MPSVVVIGAGAAGLTAAIVAAREGAAVHVIEATRKGGKKIVVSGGGRCNVLPSALDPSRFVTDSSPRTLRRMLLAWPLHEQRAFFEHDLGIPLALEAETGKLFPVSNRATDIRDGLVNAALRAGATFAFTTRVTRLGPLADRPGWRIETEGEAGPDVTEADRVVLATGGLSVPKTGSDGFGLRVAARLGHAMHPTYPALTPLLAETRPHADLSGVSLTARVHAPAGARGVQTEGGFLFTHRGYSGPAVLDVSHLTTLARERGGDQRVLVQWADRDADAWTRALLEPGAGLVLTVLREALPNRLADALLTEADVPADRARAELRKDERRRLVRVLTEYPLPWTGDEGYKKAEVTGGGVALGEVDPHTLESRRAPGLFFCGEVLDAFGPIGGYNFCWAWSTGRSAGLGAATSLASVGT
ncbi:MAG: aminoacetone oxidase family FAD-binding enzyme [Bacteroidota bacterium]